MANPEIWREPIASDPDNIASNLRILVLNLATLTPDAMQVDIASNYDASDRLNQQLKEAEFHLSLIRQDLSKKRFRLRNLNEKRRSVDENGEGKDFDINK